MKKMIALSMMAACLCMFSLGCKKPAETPPANNGATVNSSDAGGAGAEKPAEEAK